MNTLSAVESFKRNAGEVDRLVNFDRELLQIVELHVEGLHENLRKSIADERSNGLRTLEIIRGIRHNESIRSKYQAIYNQAIVLLVSHFASALGELFRYAVTEETTSENPREALLKEEFKLTVGDLKEREWNLTGSVADLLIAKYDFTFQDMGATVRAFKNYTMLLPEQGERMNNIIAAQACRNSIVHAGGRVSDKTVRQIMKIQPRRVKPNLIAGDVINFSLAEVELVKTEMSAFIEDLASQNVSF